MKYVIYKITNNINNKYYIGRHRTIDENDSYMGSGRGITNAIKKYGIENFTKEIIAETWNEDNLWELEKLLVNEDVVKDPMSYNMAYGGKHYLHGLKMYDSESYIKHQKMAGKSGGPASYNRLSSEQKIDWHKKGGSKSSQNRSKEYLYRITTNTNEEYIVNGLEFRKLCLEKNWNYKTLNWTPSFGRKITRGAHKDFMVEQLKRYEKVKVI